MNPKKAIITAIWKKLKMNELVNIRRTKRLLGSPKNLCLKKKKEEFIELNYFKRRSI